MNEVQTSRGNAVDDARDDTTADNFPTSAANDDPNYATDDTSADVADDSFAVGADDGAQKKQNFRCTECAKTYNSGFKLKQHFRHNHIGLYKCDVCDIQFNTAPELRKHNSSNHPKVHHCELCSYSHLRKYMLTRHIRHSHDARALICDLKGCNMSFSKYKRLQHLRDHHPTYSLTPKSDNCTEQSDLSEKSINGQKNEVCSGSSEDSQPSTSQSHDDRIVERCILKEQKGLYSLQKEQDWLKCTTCGKFYKNKETLTKHIRTVHDKVWGASSKNEKKFSCSVDGCVRNFRTPQEKDDHENRHKGGEPQYKCSWCELRYYARRELARHLKTVHDLSIKDFKEDA